MPSRNDSSLVPSDEDLALLAIGGDAHALEALLRGSEGWIYTLALYMLQERGSAEDATQEVLIRIATHLSTFRHESAFRTWAYRIAKNYLIDCRRSRPEEAVHGFDCFGEYLVRAPDEDLAQSAEDRILEEEAKLSCTMGMLLCLDREQRLVFVLGDILELSDTLASAVLEIHKDAFRKKLSRVRAQIEAFVSDRCGLVDPKNRCRCARKTKAFVRDGIVDPKSLLFVRGHLERVRQAAPETMREVEAAGGRQGAATRLFRDHPWFEAPNVAARLSAVLRPQGSTHGMLKA